MKSLILLLSLLTLASCTLPGSDTTQTDTTNTPPATNAYPTTQSGSPASRYCIASGGKVSIEKNPQVPNMDMAYCNLPDGRKVDAWAYMGEQTTRTGGTTTGSTQTNMAGSGASRIQDVPVEVLPQ